MARQSGWNRLVGGAVNALLPGSPYSKYSGYDPTLTRNSVISGAVGQFVPGGGQLTQALLGSTDAAQAAHYGQQGVDNLMGMADADNKAWQQQQGNWRPQIGYQYPSFSGGSVSAPQTLGGAFAGGFGTEADAGLGLAEPAQPLGMQSSWGQNLMRGLTMPTVTAQAPRGPTHSQGGAHQSMQGMGGDGAMAVLAARNPARGEKKNYPQSY